MAGRPTYGRRRARAVGYGPVRSAADADGVAIRGLYEDGARLPLSVNEAVRALRERAYGEIEAAAERGADIPALDALSRETRADPLFPIVASDMRGWESVELEHFSALDSSKYVQAGADFFIPSSTPSSPRTAPCTARG